MPCGEAVSGFREAQVDATGFTKNVRFFFNFAFLIALAAVFPFRHLFGVVLHFFLAYVGIFFGIRRKAQDMHPSIFVGIFADGPDDLCCEKQEKKIARRRETFCAAPVCRAEMRAGRPSW